MDLLTSNHLYKSEWVQPNPARQARLAKPTLSVLPCLLMDTSIKNDFMKLVQDLSHMSSATRYAFQYLVQELGLRAVEILSTTAESLPLNPYRLSYIASDG